ncbi:MAG: hypothetical protein LBR06_10040 [Bacteroidales bacterium]|jgi:hypothetical protein|nr:hypothetical protein [Bacteroidales bacterium]
MKRFINYFTFNCFTAVVASLSMLAITACEEKETTEPRMVVGPVSTALFNAEDDAVSTFSVWANGPWSITNDADWLTVTPTSGDGTEESKISISVKKNATTVDRTARILFIMNFEEMWYIDVTQNKYGPAIAVTPDNAAFTVNGGTTERAFYVVSNKDEWEVSIPKSASWLSTTGLTADSVKFVATQNRTLDKRTAVVTFALKNYPDITQEITFTQDPYAPVLTVSADKAMLEDIGDFTTVTVTADEQWEVSIPANDTWLTKSDVTASSVKLTAIQNPAAQRTSAVRFSLKEYPTITRTLNVVQDGLPEPIQLSLLVSTANALTAEELSDGSVKLTVVGNDSYINTSKLGTMLNIKRNYYITFDYKLNRKISHAEFFWCVAGGPQGERSTGQNIVIEAADNWKTFEYKITWPANPDANPMAGWGLDSSGGQAPANHFIRFDVAGNNDGIPTNPNYELIIRNFKIVAK